MSKTRKKAEKATETKKATARPVEPKEEAFFDSRFQSVLKMKHEDLAKTGAVLIALVKPAEGDNGAAMLGRNEDIEKLLIGAMVHDERFRNVMMSAAGKFAERDLKNRLPGLLDLLKGGRFEAGTFKS